LQYTPLHFYRLGKEFVKGKKVLDLECSKGHGSFLLAEDAGSVIALDENERSIRYASSHFLKENLAFKKGSLLDQSREGQALFDVIIWFRSMSNITELEKQLPMIHRFLKEGGIFLVSLPNKRNDLSSLNYPLGYRSSLNEFKSLLNKYFEYTLMYGQKIYPSSNIFPLFNTSESAREYLIEKGEENFLFVSPERKEAEYFIAVSSNQPLENVAADSYLIDASECLFKFKEAQIKSLEEELCDKEAHIENLELVMSEKDIHIGNLEAAIRDKDNYIGNLERQREQNYRDWQAHEKNLRTMIKEKDQYIESLKEAMDSKDKYIKDFETTLESKVNEILKLHNYIESMIKEKDQYIESLKEAMDSKDEYAKDLERNLESIVPEKDKYIESLKEAMDSKDKYAKDLERNLESIVPEKDKYIESLLNALDGKAKEVADLNTSIVQKNEDIERLNSELNALKNTVIYRLLKKFRFVKM
jgi:ubiquinone/menaquinone biosynthesis C-methylase UbiE/flagellar biosynthesis chaperone FliJ